jgi:mannose/cellobiose epimerase-like protein (N-acyl-D-glucosamine 2-epimerase family)
VSASAPSPDPESLLAYLRTRLLPLWVQRGFDTRHGGFHNRLDRGTLEPAPDGNKRLLVQTRQIFALAWASRMFGDPLLAERARAGFAFLRQRYLDPVHGGWFLTVTPEGEPLDRSKDLYAHAFVLLALSELALLPDSGDLRAIALELARETTALLVERLGDPAHGGLLEGASESWVPLRGTRRQNPHMHLFEALLALHAAGAGDVYLERALELGTLLRERWIDPERGCLFEYFTPDWRVDLSVENGAVEPGHCFEWVWLLHRHPRLRDDPGLRGVAEALWCFASRHGLDPRDGAPFDVVTASGEVLRDTKRAWPQTEYLKALGVRAEWYGCTESRERVGEFAGLCLARYVDASHGGWNEHTDRAGQVISPLMNATTVYHVMLALVDAARLLGARG